MANIIRLQENERNIIPTETCRVFKILQPEDELVAIEKFIIIYGRSPEKAYRWRNLMYFPLDTR